MPGRRDHLVTSRVAAVQLYPVNCTGCAGASRRSLRAGFRDAQRATPGLAWERRSRRGHARAHHCGPEPCGSDAAVRRRPRTVGRWPMSLGKGGRLGSVLRPLARPRPLPLRRLDGPVLRAVRAPLRGRDPEAHAGRSDRSLPPGLRPGEQAALPRLAAGARSLDAALLRRRGAGRQDLEPGLRRGGASAEGRAPRRAAAHATCAARLRPGGQDRGLQAAAAVEGRADGLQRRAGGAGRDGRAVRPRRPRCPPAGRP
mmetsp:Transcript_122985/g.358980  ORF Transcript_122985/g.358980 Transcript_122985/m.358980 type:complete len:257 (+) Transcript_122985:474-1244(+)